MKISTPADQLEALKKLRPQKPIVLPLTADELETLEAAARAEQASPTAPVPSGTIPRDQRADAPSNPEQPPLGKEAERLLIFILAGITVLLERARVTPQEFQAAIQATVTDLAGPSPTSTASPASGGGATTKGDSSEQY